MVQRSLFFSSGKYCNEELKGQRVIVQAESSPHTVELYFKTDGSVTRPGFECTIKGEEGDATNTPEGMFHTIPPSPI